MLMQPCNDATCLLHEISFSLFYVHWYALCCPTDSRLQSEPCVLTANDKMKNDILSWPSSTEPSTAEPTPKPTIFQNSMKKYESSKFTLEWNCKIIKTMLNSLVRLTPSSFIGFPTAFWSCSCWSRLTASWKPMTRSPAPWTPTALNRRLIYIGHVRSAMFREEVHVCLMLILMYRQGVHRTYQAAQAPKRCSSTRRCSGSKRFRFFFLRRT